MNLQPVKATIAAAMLVLLGGCATPFQPPVIAKGSSDFPGLVELVSRGAGQPVDVVLVHGMCTTTASWPISAMLKVSSAVGAIASVPSVEEELSKAKPNEIQLVPGSAVVAGGTIRYTGLVWSPLVKDLKDQLLYDMTGKESDCATSDECKPRRAWVNGLVKDSLLNDCFADALAYQGKGRTAFKTAMVDALTQVIQQASDSNGPIVVVAASLGSKMVFDAMTDMLTAPKNEAEKLAAEAIQGRLAVVFMAANQLPILGLADQDILVNKSAIKSDSATGDSLQRFLNAREENAAKSVRANAKGITQLSVVAFTDPNDLLSYRLLPSRYKSTQVKFADILVSNRPTFFGLLENPLTAHSSYLANFDVARFIACGSDTGLCK